MASVACCMGRGWPTQPLADALLAAAVMAGRSLADTTGSSAISVSQLIVASFAAADAVSSNLPT